MINMNKRKCEDCGKEMEMWFSVHYADEKYEEWFCKNCNLYHEYEDDELVKKFDLGEEVEG